MRSSKFAFASLTISLLLLLFAIVITIDPPESNQVGLFALPFGIILSMLDMPLYYFGFSFSFPAVLPTLSLILAAISLRKKENKQVLATISIALILISFSLFLVVYSFGTLSHPV